MFSRLWVEIESNVRWLLSWFQSRLADFSGDFASKMRKFVDKINVAKRNTWNEVADCVNSSSPLILRKFPGFRGIWANSGKFGKFRENSGEFSGIQWGFCMALSMNSVGIPGGFRGNAGFSRKLGVWGGFGWFGGSKGFCANSQNEAWKCPETLHGQMSRHFYLRKHSRRLFPGSLKFNEKTAIYKTPPGRERKNEHELFFAQTFLSTPRCPGHPGKIPGISQIPLFENPRKDKTFEGGHEVFDPHPFAWKTPTPPSGLRTQKVNLCALFSCLTGVRFYKPPCVQLIKQPFCARHQVFCTVNFLF